MNFDCLKADLNIFIPIHNCCPISVLRDYQNNCLNVSYHNGPETQDIFKYTICVNRLALCIGIHMLPNHRKTSTLIPKRPRAMMINIQRYQPYWTQLFIMQRMIYNWSQSVLHPSGAWLHHTHLIVTQTCHSHTNSSRGGRVTIL